MTISTETRELRLEIAHNVRHLGGYQTRDGRVTRDTIIRSAGLSRLTAAGLGVLADSGVRVIVDLRSTVERERDVTPDVTPFGITRIEAAVFEQDASPKGLGDQFHGFAPVYREMLEMGRPAYRALFEAVASTNGRLLFHCAAGKDRTGVGAALMLDLAGVDDETIVADYARSAALLTPLLDRWLPEMKERGVPEERARALMDAKPGDIRDTLGHVRERFGSAEGYLRSLGLSEAVISDIRARMVA